MRVPFLELGVVGPSKVFEALSELAVERLVSADSIELTGRLLSLDILSGALLSRAGTVGGLLKTRSDRYMQAHLDSLDEAIAFSERSLRSATSLQHLRRLRPRH